MTHEARIDIPVTYQREWVDGFGARGWKLNSALHDADVIAATAETGNRIPTSVLVHDILDHYLCGLPLSGHRNEAKVLYQLATRTGSDPTPDFAQMVDEDLLYGRTNGESLREFLPAWLLALVPEDITEGRELIHGLESRLGRSALRQVLIMRFFEIGAGDAFTAMHQFESTGLNYCRRTAYGESLQQVLREADEYVMNTLVETVKGTFFLCRERCGLDIRKPDIQHFEASYNIHEQV